MEGGMEEAKIIIYLKNPQIDEQVKRIILGEIKEVSSMEVLKGLLLSCEKHGIVLEAVRENKNYPPTVLTRNEIRIACDGQIELRPGM
jgi:hypothetical protein